VRVNKDIRKNERRTTMKTTKFSLNKKIMASASMLLVSTFMLSSATYAWFTMNKSVTVSGMEVRTKVGSNLLISHDSDITATTKNDDDTFTTSDTTAIKAWLEPVSTNNAAANNFWYTLNAKADGSKDSGDYVDYDQVGLGNATSSSYSNKFSEEYGVLKTEVTGFGATTTPNDAAVGYVDYVFQLKATNTLDSAQTINLTQLALTYDKDETGSERNGEVAFRAAVFVEPENAGKTAYATAGGATLNAIYKPSAAAYFTGTNGVSGASATTAVSNLVTDTAVPLASVSGGDTNYYKVVVRLWLEGEDTTCTSETFANLTDTWSLDLTLELGQGTPVTAMTMVDGYTPAP
jgi:hypothetical protein